MTRIGIVTNYHSTGNYGALLQAYALNRVINQMPNVECKTIDLSIDNADGSKVYKYLKKLKMGNYIQVIKDIDKDIRKLVIRNKIRTRRQALNSFRDSIPHTKTIKSDGCNSISSDFDILVCGSDQIWRPSFEETLIRPYWLEGFSQDTKKVSYAASMGVETFPQHLIPQVNQYLEKFDYISVREQQAEIYLKQISNRNDICTVIDPVFLLNREEWKEILQKPNNEEKYVLVYMIHGDKEILHNIEKFAANHNVRILSFPYMSYYYKSRDRAFGDIHDFSSSPAEFLGLIDSSEYVITDSFHATAFSILLHKKFVTSGSNKKALSRIDNLLDNLHVSGQLLTSSSDDIEAIMDNVIDWSDVDKAIQNERAKSMGFLRRALSSEGDWKNGKTK